MLLLALICVLVVGQVIGRNLFNTGMPWADELSRFCGVAIVFLCVPLLALRDQHVAVDMVPMMLPEKQGRWISYFTELMVLAFACLMLWSLYAFLGRAWKFATPTLSIPNWVFYAPAIISFTLLAIVTISRLATPSSRRSPESPDRMLP
ncbi:TRAP transporter small permease [Mesorhizobium xinjiangense]|uniref:TRAP transporter small permease n=1 Tax=Mesorhizobium xinjiangense TaxID=2678685 RepID=UPI001F1BBD22|nr:TRAP transporter small permease [Mesorhizobium xinjiangense]